MKLTKAEMLINEVAEQLSTMKVNVPVGERKNISVKKIQVTQDEVIRSMSGSSGPRAYTPPGEYTALYMNDSLWMSDTFSERMDHLWFIRKCISNEYKSVIVTGLGLGMVIHGLVRLAPAMERITVVEKNVDVLNLLSQHYAEMCFNAGIEIEFIRADVWVASGGIQQHDAAWHDIWPTIDEDNLTEFAEIKDLYSSCVEHYQECWGEKQLSDPALYMIMLNEFAKVMNANSNVLDSVISGSADTNSTKKDGK